MRLLAAELGMTVDTRALLYCDVRDLMALRRGLQAVLRDGDTLPRHCDRAGVLTPPTAQAAGPMSKVILLLAGILHEIIWRR